MVQNEIAILIKSYFDAKAFNQAASASRRLKETFKDMGTPVAKLNSAFEGKDLFSGLADSAKQMQSMRIDDAYLKRFGTSLAGLATVSQKTREAILKDYSMGGHDKFINQLMSSRKQLRSLGLDASNVRATFQMEFLGIMFLGMQIQKTFSAMAKSAVSSFMKATEATTSSGQAVNALTASWELLKFSLGSAIATVLELLLPYLIPIITAISDWVQRNEKLSGGLILAGIALGGFLFLVGQMVLGVSSLLQGLSKVVGWFASTGTAADKAGSKVGGFTNLLKGLALAAAVGFAISFVMDAWKVLTTDGSTLWDYTKVVGKAVIAGALFGFVFGGLPGAVIGAAIGALIGVVTVAFDVVTEVHRDLKTLNSLGISTMDAMKQAFKDAEPNGVWQRFSDGLLFNIPVMIRMKQSFDRQANEGMAQAEVQGKIRFVSQYGGAEGAESAAVQMAQKKAELENALQTTAQTTTEYKELTNEINVLDSAISNIASALGTNVDMYYQLAQNQEAVATQTEALSLASQTYAPTIDQMATASQDLMNNMDAKKVKSLRDSIVDFVDTLNGKDFTKLAGLSVTMATLTDVMTTGIKDSNGKSGGGLSTALTSLIQLISGSKDSLITSFINLQDTLIKQQTYIETTLLGLYGRLETALIENATAANNAASAHERYNRALQGGT